MDKAISVCLFTSMRVTLPTMVSGPLSRMLALAVAATAVAVVFSSPVIRAWVSVWTYRARRGVLQLTRLVLWDVYFHGMGFWHGASEAAACAHLTGVSEAHWASNSDTCTALLATRFEGLVVAVGTIVFVFASYRVLVTAVRFVCLGPTKPLSTSNTSRDTPTRQLITAILNRLSPRRHQVANAHTTATHPIGDARYISNHVRVSSHADA